MKELQRLNDMSLPVWFVNPLNEVDEQEVERLQAKKEAAERALAEE